MLALLGLDLGGSADLDDSHAASQLGQTLLQLLTVVIRVGVLDLSADLGHASVDVFLGASALNDGGLVLGDDDLLGVAEHGGVDGLELQAQFVGDNLSTGQDGHILQHGLATVAKARGLDGAGLEGATDVVQDQGRQCFAVDVLSDDQQRLAGLHDQLGHVHDVLLGGDLAGGQQNVRVFEHCGLVVSVGDEVRGDVALVETHALGEVEVQAEAVVVFNGHNAVLADLVQSLSDLLADLRVSGGDGGGSSDLVLGLDVLGGSDEFLDDDLGGLLDAATQGDRVGAGDHVLQTLVNQGLSEHGCSGGAVTGDVVGLLGDFLDQLGADALVRVFKVDFLGDGHAIVGDGRSAVGLVEHDVAALRAQSDLDGVGELVKALQHALTGFLIIRDDLCHGCVFLQMARYTGYHSQASSRDDQPSAADYHSRPPSANPDISTRARRVPTPSAAIALWA